MSQIDVLNQEGKVVKQIELADAVFGITPNQQAIYDAILVYQAGLRQGTHSTKTRAFVSGTGKKPFRQKGTGRARQGSTRAPQWTHGGIAHGPKPREYGFSINKKVRRLAMKSAFSSKVAAEELVVLDDLKLDAIKTKEVVKVLTALETGKKVLLVLPENNDVLYRSARNIAGVKVSTVNTLNVYDILNCDTMLVLKDSVAKIEEVYA